MTVYCKKISKKWREAFNEFEDLSGFEITGQQDIDTGLRTPREVWDKNIEWLEDMVSSCSNIKTPAS